MNIKEISDQIDTLAALMTAEDEKYDIFYGVYDGKLGFHIVGEDYPDYFIAFLGENFVEAQADIEQSWME